MRDQSMTSLTLLLLLTFLMASAAPLVTSQDVLSDDTVAPASGRADAAFTMWVVMPENTTTVQNGTLDDGQTIWDATIDGALNATLILDHENVQGIGEVIWRINGVEVDNTTNSEWRWTLYIWDAAAHDWVRQDADPDSLPLEDDVHFAWAPFAQLSPYYPGPTPDHPNATVRNVSLGLVEFASDELLLTGGNLSSISSSTAWLAMQTWAGLNGLPLERADEVDGQGAVVVETVGQTTRTGSESWDWLWHMWNGSAWVPMTEAPNTYNLTSGDAIVLAPSNLTADDIPHPDMLEDESGILSAEQLAGLTDLSISVGFDLGGDAVMHHIMADMPALAGLLDAWRDSADATGNGGDGNGVVDAAEATAWHAANGALACTNMTVWMWGTTAGDEACTTIEVDGLAGTEDASVWLNTTTTWDGIGTMNPQSFSFAMPDLDGLPSSELVSVSGDMMLEATAPMGWMMALEPGSVAGTVTQVSSGVATLDMTSTQSESWDSNSIGMSLSSNDTAPSLSGSMAATITAGEAVVTNLTITDEDAGNSTIWWWVDGGMGVMMSAGGMSTVTVSVANLSQGTHNLAFKAEDVWGQWSGWHNVSVVVQQLSEPVANVTLDAATVTVENGTNVTITGTVGHVSIGTCAVSAAPAGGGTHTGSVALNGTFSVTVPAVTNSGLVVVSIVCGEFTTTTATAQVTITVSTTSTPDDADGDGVPDASDDCADTPSNQTANDVGCSPEQLDTGGNNNNTGGETTYDVRVGGILVTVRTNGLNVAVTLAGTDQGDVGTDVIVRYSLDGGAGRPGSGSSFLIEPLPAPGQHTVEVWLETTDGTEIEGSRASGTVTVTEDGDVIVEADDEGGLPGFPAVLATLAMLGAAILIARRRSD